MQTKLKQFFLYVVCSLQDDTELFIFLNIHSNDLEDFYLNVELKDDW